jgi:hypothetical protein
MVPTLRTRSQRDRDETAEAPPAEPVTTRATSETQRIITTLSTASLSLLPDESPIVNTRSSPPPPPKETVQEALQRRIKELEKKLEEEQTQRLVDGRSTGKRRRRDSSSSRSSSDYSISVTLKNIRTLTERYSLRARKA